MHSNTIRQIITKFAIFPFLLLSGCLSSEKAVTQYPGNGDPSQNNPPTIFGNPQPAVMIGTGYSFTPTAVDPDGDNLTFHVQNMPSWTTFESSTGTLSGSPILENVGTYQDIQISVSDGSLGSILHRFSVEVVETALGSVTLSWTPPTQYGDGSILADLAAYKFYYGTTPGTYTRSILIENAGIASYVVENLVPNTYFFVATAVNSNGVESGFSNEATKEIL